MTVVIPTGQYANVQPTITGVGESFEEAQADVLRKAASFYETIDAQAQLSIRIPEVKKPIVGAQYQIMKDWFDGTEVYYDDAAHHYVDKDGNEYMSGSRFAGMFEHEFKTEAIVPAYAAKYGVSEQDVKDMWAAKADASTTFGTALHQALETYGKYWRVCVATGKDPLLEIPATLRPAVEAFWTEEKRNTDYVCEMFAADANKHRSGQLDLVTIVDRENKIIDIEDYKTNAELFKVGSPKQLKAPFQHLPNMAAAKYTIQLSFYKAIAESKGWTVRSLKLHHWTGLSEPGEDAKWETIELRAEQIDSVDRIDLSKVL